MVDPHPIPHPDLAGYILGGLDTGEAAEFEAHLTACDACRTEVDELASLPSLLDAAVPAVELPAHLRELTLDAALAAGRKEPPATDRPPASTGEAVISNLDKHRARRRPAPHTRWGRPTLLAAAAVAAVLLAVVSVNRPDTGQTTTEIALASTPGTVKVERTPSGWRIDLNIELPRRADGRHYEAFLAGPPGRISVGTFNEGDDVTLWAGVPPSTFRDFVVVEQPGDLEIIRAQLQL